jgi:hypothetical protein
MNLQSDGCELRVDERNGAISVVDRATGRLWREDPWRQEAGRLILADQAGRALEFSLSSAEKITCERTGDAAVTIHFRHLGTTPDNGWNEVSVRTRLTVTADGFDVEILEVTHPGDCRFVSLEYPARFGALLTDQDAGELVIAYWQGSLVPSTTGAFSRIPRVPFWAWDDMPWREPGTVNLPVYSWNGLSMPFFGLVHGRSTWAVVLQTEDDAAVRCYLNSNLQNEMDARGGQSTLPRIAAVSPLWLASRGEWKYPRRATYRLLPGGGYNAIAKHYREIARARGLVVTLREKIARNPHIGTAVGGPLVNVMGGYPWYIDPPAFRASWAQVDGLFADMSARLGVKNAIACLWMGYRHYPPNSFPFHDAHGSEAELVDMVAQARARNFLVCFYHGYPALLDHDPAAPAWREARQVDRHGAIKSRWGRLCSSQYLKYARANLPRSIAVSRQVADYSDMVTAGPIDECWSAEHGLTRTQDRRNKEQLFEYINSLGLFTGSETARGWAVPHLAYAKNGGTMGNHPILSAIPIPLFSLVFKDCLLLYREHQSVADTTIYNDVAMGNHPQAHFAVAEYAGLRDKLQAPLALFAQVNRSTGLEELREHRFADEINGPFATQFANGTSIAVNPTLEPRTVDGRELAAETMFLQLAGGPTVEVKPLARGFSAVTR